MNRFDPVYVIGGLWAAWLVFLMLDYGVAHIQARMDLWPCVDVEGRCVPWPR